MFTIKKEVVHYTKRSCTLKKCKTFIKKEVVHYTQNTTLSMSVLVFTFILFSMVIFF